MTDKITFRTSEEIGKTIRDLSESEHEGNLSKAMNYLINKALNRFDILGDGCPARTYIDDHYECTWGRKGKTPDTKKIGISDQAMNNRCSACKKTLDMKEKIYTMEQRLAKGVIVDIPNCIHGGKLSNDGKKLYCKNPHMLSQNRDVEKWCKVVRNGANCESLRWTRIAVKGKLPDGQNL